MKSLTWCFGAAFIFSAAITSLNAELSDAQLQQFQEQGRALLAHVLTNRDDIEDGLLQDLRQQQGILGDAPDLNQIVINFLLAEDNESRRYSWGEFTCACDCEDLDGFLAEVRTISGDLWQQRYKRHITRAEVALAAIIASLIPMIVGRVLGLRYGEDTLMTFFSMLPLFVTIVCLVIFLAFDATNSCSSTFPAYLQLFCASRAQWLTSRVGQWFARCCRLPVGNDDDEVEFE